MRDYQSPPPTAMHPNLPPATLLLDAGPEDDWVVSGDDVVAVGTLFLDSLLTLKHLGAQSQTAEALESVCKRLLAHGSKHLALAALPRTWMSDLLLKFDNADSLRLVSVQVLILAVLLASDPVPDPVPNTRFHEHFANNPHKHCACGCHTCHSPWCP